MISRHWKLAIIVPLIVLMFSSTQISAAGKYTEANLLVDNSHNTLKQFIADPNMQVIKDLSKRARGIIIIPQMIRAGLVVGGVGGSGILFARNMKTGLWNGPAFYSIGSLTFGLQIGGEVSQVVMFVMTDRGMKSMMSSSFKFGADVTMAAGPIGGGAKTVTADILAYARSKGAFGGFTVEGGVMQTMDSWNTSYYDSAAASPYEILITHSIANSYGDEIIKTITEIGTPTTQKVKY
jgi:lipid-binding SYLF domain-containing protein